MDEEDNSPSTSRAPSTPPDPDTGISRGLTMTARPSHLSNNGAIRQSPPSHLPLAPTTSIEYEPGDAMTVDMDSGPNPPAVGAAANAAQQIRYTLGRLLTEMDGLSEEQVTNNPSIIGDVRSELHRLSANLGESPRRPPSSLSAPTDTARHVTHNHTVVSTPVRQANVSMAQSVRRSLQTPMGTSGIRSSSQVAVTTPGDWPSPGVQSNANTPGQPRTIMQELSDAARFLRHPIPQAIIAWLLRVAPFLGIYLLKWCVENMVRITFIATAIWAFIDCNFKLEQFHKSVTASRLSPVRAALPLVIWISMTYYVLHDDRLCNPMLYRSPNLHLDSVSNTLWVAFVADTTSKFAAMITKCVISLIPILSLRRRGRLFQFLEYTHQVYRYTLTPLLWMTYYQHPIHMASKQYPDHSLVPDVVQNTLAWIIILLYVGIKVHQCRALLHKLWRSVRALFLPQPYGMRATGPLLERAGVHCAVCFQEYDKPLALSCGHVFCESCIGVWLDKERTCPICRTQVVQEDKDWTDATTTCLIQLF